MPITQTYVECDYWVIGYAVGDEFCNATQPSYGSGQYGEPAKLILSWMPPKKRKKDEEAKVEIVEDAIEQALEAAPVAPLVSSYEIELAARLLLAEYTLTELRRIKYAETLLDRIQAVMAEMDDEEVLLLAI